MSIKRTNDPAGLLPDHVRIEPEGKPGELEAIHSMLAFNAPVQRIVRLRRHSQLIERADELEALRISKGGKADAHLLMLIAGAEHSALYLDAAPKVIRDNARQNGTRGPRRKEINEWISKQLDRDSNAKSPDLWRAAPQWLTDQLGERRFAARVTKARKARK